jgi:tetratricopeptide (TPR) repeat protein
MIMQGGRTWAAIIAGMIGLVYANTFTVPFIFDDDNAIVANPTIRHLWPPRYLWDAPPQSTVAGRPLVSATLAVNYAISELRPWSYHVVNLLLHIGCAWLVFGLARHATGQQHLAGALALVWAVHPLLTETVTYVIQRTELLMAFCYLLTIFSVTRGRHLAAVLACAAGMACKEVMVTAPVAVWLYDRTFMAGSFREAFRQRGGLYAALAGTWAVLAAILLAAPRGETVGFGFSHVTPWQYLLTQSGVMVRYLQLSVWPQPLTLDYFDWPVAKSVADVWLPGLLVAGGMAGTVWALVRQPKLGFLLAWVLLILAPTSSVVPIASEVVAERRMYLPLIGVVGGLAFCRGNYRWVLCGVAVLAGSVGTWRRNMDYRDAVSIWEDTVAKRPENPRALVNLGEALVRRGDEKQALELFERAVAVQPAHTDARFNLGVMLASQGRQAEAVEHLERAARGEPGNEKFQANLGIVLANLGRLEEARAALERAPGSSIAHDTLGVLHAWQGRMTEAVKHFQEAVRLDPKNQQAQQHLATALRQQREK